VAVLPADLAPPTEGLPLLPQIENRKSEIENPPPIPSSVDSAPYFVFSQRYARPIEWLVPGLIPLGKVTLLVGDPGIGKSLLAVDLAARVTRGEAVPPDVEERAPARVLYLAGDGETEDILPERLSVFGADLARVAGIEDPDADDRPVSEIKMLSLARDLDRLHETLRRWTECRLIVIDPVSAFVEGIDPNSNMDVRRLLTRLATIARRYNAAVLVISHFRKSGAPHVLYRSLGSIAFTLATRVVLTMVADQAVAGRRLILPAKMNPLRHFDQHGRAFSIGDDCLIWDEERLSVAGDDLRELMLPGCGVQDRVDEVARWLIAKLNWNTAPAAEVIQAARDEDIPWRVLQAARKRAGVESIRDGKEGRWYWKMRFNEVVPNWMWGGGE